MMHLSQYIVAKAFKPALLGLTLMSTAACMHDSIANPVVGETVTRNTVTLVRLAYTIEAEDDGTDTLSAGTAASLQAFLQSVGAGHGDIIMLDSASTAGRRDAIAQTLRKRGLVYGGEAPLGETPEGGNIALYVERYLVTPPACGQWPNEPTNNTRNNASAYFGCSNTANLGLMVADPRDLIAGQHRGNSTAAAVGAIYTPVVKPAGPSMTLSIDGMPGATQQVPLGRNTPPAGSNK
ncbi:CpaD family pilus assembly protein [Kordiimonas aestuarii]|uniref:CpaD family pilus assembly protein n=1 Tax=Kordiimonas aestuarii TaxID=1005925 RepID=UPI0021CE5A8C|nr:CpaD family pilus assembly protein [Kordiimonas aestuarii]